MVTKYVWPMATSAVVVVAGMALLIWPFALHTNVGGWTHATMSDFWSGIGLVVLGLISLMAWYGGLRKELVSLGVMEEKSKAVDASRPEEFSVPRGNDDNLDQLLRPLAETVLRDLTEQLAAKEGHRSGGGNAS